VDEAYGDEPVDRFALGPSNKVRVALIISAAAAGVSKLGTELAAIPTLGAARRTGERSVASGETMAGRWFTVTGLSLYADFSARRRFTTTRTGDVQPRG
jgi:hypothetical protein